MRSFAEYCERARRSWDNDFDDSALDRRFVPYFESGERIKVRTLGEEKTGTVSVTAGWRPCFLLMLRRTSIGSPWILGPNDEILAVQRNGKYVPVHG